MTNPFKAGDCVIYSDFGTVLSADYDDNIIRVQWDNPGPMFTRVDAEHLRHVEALSSGTIITALRELYLHGINTSGKSAKYARLLDGAASALLIATLAPAPLPVMIQAERALVAAYGEPGPEPANLESKQGRNAILAIRVLLDWYKRVEAHATKPT